MTFFVALGSRKSMMSPPSCNHANPVLLPFSFSFPVFFFPFLSSSPPPSSSESVSRRMSSTLEKSTVILSSSYRVYLCVVKSMLLSFVKHVYPHKVGGYIGITLSVCLCICQFICSLGVRAITSYTLV